MKPMVGFAGMGLMGKPMAQNLAKAGYDVAVYNRTRPEPDAVPGLAVAATPHELASDREVLILMLTGPEAAEAVLFGDNGMAPSLGTGRTVINMSTIPPAAATDLAARVSETGAVYVDAPVSGSKVQAREGTLVILAGGPGEIVDRLEPLFLSMGKKVARCGGVPQGSMMKLSINLLLASMMSGLSEMLTFGRAGGLAPQVMLDAVLNGPMGCELFKIKEPLLAQNKFLAQFPLKHMAKDLRFIADTACDLRAPAPSAFLNLQLYNQAMSKGLGELDFSAIIQVFESMI